MAMVGNYPVTLKLLICGVSRAEIIECQHKRVRKTVCLTRGFSAAHWIVSFREWEARTMEDLRGSVDAGGTSPENNPTPWVEW